MNSRRTRPFCRKDPGCNDPKVLCDNMQDDLLHAVEIRKQFPQRVHLVRYEDLSLYPFKETDAVFNFLGLQKTMNIEKYIEEHTFSKREDEDHPEDHQDRKKVKRSPFSTKKDSKATAFAWKQELTFEDTLKIQRVCSKPMKAFGYKSFSKSDELKSKEINSLSSVRGLSNIKN